MRQNLVTYFGTECFLVTLYVICSDIRALLYVSYESFSMEGGTLERLTFQQHFYLSLR